MVAVTRSVVHKDKRSIFVGAFLLLDLEVITQISKFPKKALMLTTHITPVAMTFSVNDASVPIVMTPSGFFLVVVVVDGLSRFVVYLVMQ